MPQPNDLSRSLVALDRDSTIIAVVEMSQSLCFAPAADVPGVEFAVLYESAWELVSLERWAPGASRAVPIPEGIELLVLDGSFIDGGEEFKRLSWLRLPAGATLRGTAGRGGCKVWVKSGHLAREPRPPRYALMC